MRESKSVVRSNINSPGARPLLLSKPSILKYASESSWGTRSEYLL